MTTRSQSRRMASESTEKAYQTVLEHSQRVLDLEKTNQLLRWDSDVMMPPGGAPARASQRTTLSTARNRYITAARRSRNWTRRRWTTSGPRSSARFVGSTPPP